MPKEEIDGTYYGKSYFNDDVTFYGSVTFGSDTNLSFGVGNELSLDKVSIGSSLRVGSATTTGVIIVGAAVTITGATPASTTSTAISVTGIVTATTFSGGGTIPLGGIIMWSGTIANIPTGWALCDGTTVNGRATPDLRSRFIVGATSDASTGVTFNVTTGATTGAYAVGNTGGETAHQLTIAELASHDHSYSDTTGTGNGGGNSGPNNPGTITSVSQSTSSKTTGAQGSSNFHENRPPFFALAFIMRVS